MHFLFLLPTLVIRYIPNVFFFTEEVYMNFKIALEINMNQVKMCFSMSFLILGNNTAKSTLVAGQRQRSYNRGCLTVVVSLLLPWSGLRLLTSFYFCCWIFIEDLGQVYLWPLMAVTTYEVIKTLKFASLRNYFCMLLLLHFYFLGYCDLYFLCFQI